MNYLSNQNIKKKENNQYNSNYGNVQNNDGAINNINSMGIANDINLDDDQDDDNDFRLFK